MKPPDPRPVSRFRYELPAGEQFTNRGRSLLDVSTDGCRLVTGGPVPIVEGVWRSLLATAHYAISASGTLVYAVDTPLDQRTLALVDRDGVAAPLDVPPAPYMSPGLSPDGRKLVVQTLGEEENAVLWIYDLVGDEAIHQLTFEGDNSRPIWSPDSQRVTFTSNREGDEGLFWKAADGSGVAARLTTVKAGTDHRAGSWSPDGRTLSFMIVRGLDWDIWTLVGDGEATPESLYDLPPRMYHGPEFSPDGKWLAYGVGESMSDHDIYVEPFPPSGARRRISQQGGNFPVWSPDGRELLYRRTTTAGSVTLHLVDVTTTPDFTVGSEQTSPVEGFLVFSTYRDYDITPDGQHFVMVFPATTQARDKIDIVQNFFEELKEKVPN